MLPLKRGNQTAAQCEEGQLSNSSLFSSKIRDHEQGMAEFATTSAYAKNTGQEKAQKGLPSQY